MASLNTLPDFRFALTVGLTLALAACGGGGSKDSAASTQSVGGENEPARVSYVWDFEGDASTQYRPVKDGTLTSVGTLTTCADNAGNCLVTQDAGRAGGHGLRFYPDAPVAASFAWLAGGRTDSVCSSGILQFDPFGTLDYRMTVALWINPDRIDNTATYHLFGTGDPTSIGPTLKTASFHLRIVRGKVQMSFYPSKYSDSADLILESATTLSATGSGSHWHHLAVTYDNTKVILYVDGKPDTTVNGLPVDVAQRDPNKNRIEEACRPYYLGGMSALVSVNGAPVEARSLIFPGVIDQLVFSNKAYTADEILKLAGGLPAK